MLLEWQIVLLKTGADNPATDMNYSRQVEIGNKHLLDLLGQ